MNLFKFLRSSVAGRVPTVAQLPAGQIGFNTADNKMFFGNGTQVTELRNKTTLTNGMDSYQFGSYMISAAGLNGVFSLNSPTAKDTYLNYADGMASNLVGLVTPGKMLLRKVVVGLAAAATSDVVFEIYVNKVLKETKTLMSGSDREVFSSTLLLNSRDMIGIRVTNTNVVQYPICMLDLAYKD